MEIKDGFSHGFWARQWAIVNAIRMAALVFVLVAVTSAAEAQHAQPSPPPPVTFYPWNRTSSTSPSHGLHLHYVVKCSLGQ
jgi:hypothetical protein